METVVDRVLKSHLNCVTLIFCSLFLIECVIGIWLVKLRVVSRNLGGLGATSQSIILLICAHRIKSTVDVVAIVVVAVSLKGLAFCKIA